MTDGVRAAVCLMCLAAVLLPGCASPVVARRTAAPAAAEATPAPTVTNIRTQASSPLASPTQEPAATPARAAAAPIASPQAATPSVTGEDPGEPSQAVVVIASGRSAIVTLCERDGVGWRKLVETKGCVGRAGVTADKHEGDKKTPNGVYALDLVFGTEQPDTKMEFRPITGESYWVDDPQSEYYNTWQEGYKGWASAEKLSEYPSYYHYAVAIAYNTQCVPGDGSAIFLHCMVKSYTSGCVAVPERALLKILKALDPGKRPVIVIAGSAEEADNYGILPFSGLDS